VDVVEAHIEKPLPGFGELFRMLSYEEIGAGAMLSRALAGVTRNTLVFAMPGSTNAVKLAMTKLILPELKHLAWEIVRQQPTDESTA
jgi:molybdenum cofactor biosynthesis protein B